MVRWALAALALWVAFAIAVFLVPRVRAHFARRGEVLATIDACKPTSPEEVCGWRLEGARWRETDFPHSTEVFGMLGVVSMSARKSPARRELGLSGSLRQQPVPQLIELLSAELGRCERPEPHRYVWTVPGEGRYELNLGEVVACGEVRYLYDAANPPGARADAIWLKVARFLVNSRGPSEIVFEFSPQWGEER